ncbi:putative metalloprotease with PDZ domain [Caldalkalibacillus uzonensis]|uniref:Metalloprotease with PDZ domain n=1 Tax=Caldalkalibacillus uzonensis TaxID=353224 RepID=A0ABU0CN39_9BACI|nr:cytosolic protein [Caldalkalibacillus uzonensis]MDQ0337837.1 putative metalloprotease with PDZ domain [Caldalkalibacillus uzonensis]
MGLRDFFTNRAETSDTHPNQALQTRYYKTTGQQAMKFLRDVIEQDPRLRLLSYSEEHAEITAEYIKPKKAFVVVSVIMVFPYRTAVDLTISTQTVWPTDFGFSRKQVQFFYRKLDERFEFAGTGLGEKKS